MHERLREALEPYVDAVLCANSPSLLVGEDGFPFDDLSVLVAERLPSRYVPKTTPERVREVISEFSGTTRVRLVGFNLTGASEAAQNALLKLVEDGIPGVSVHLYAPAPSLGGVVLPTVLSRCFVVTLAPASLALTKAVLAARGVSEGMLSRVTGHYSGSLAEAILEYDLDTSSRVAELLRALESRDAARAFTVSRGFDRDAARHLSLLIRGHLLGKAHVPGLGRAAHRDLAEWAVQLESAAVHPGLATRWGLLEVLGV